MTPGVVVVGGYINGLGLVRSFGAAGIPTAVVCTQRYDLAHRSRYAPVHESALGLIDRPDLLAEVLERRSADWRGWALIPANDEALTALSQGHEPLSVNHRVIAPPWEIARRFLDKRLTREAASSVGVDVPHCYGPAGRATAALPNLRFPVLVKPAVGHPFSARFGCKLFFASDRDELRRYCARVEKAQLAAEIFDFVPGGDDALYFHCSYIDSRGEPSPGLTVHKIRQSPPLFGVARVAEIVDDIPELREATLEIARHTGLRGILAAEYKRDPRDGKFRLLEINARSSIFNALLRRAGLDLAQLAWADQVEGRPQRSAPNGWSGVWVNVHSDLLHSAFSRRRAPVGLAEFLAPYRRPKVEAVWSVRDPAPFLTQWCHPVMDVQRRMSLPR